jgi:hypothetical protein
MKGNLAICVLTLQNSIRRGKPILRVGHRHDRMYLDGWLARSRLKMPQKHETAAGHRRPKRHARRTCTS